MSYANNKGADQPAHPRFVVRCLDSIISLDSIAKISRLYLASVAAQVGLCLVCVRPGRTLPITVNNFASLFNCTPVGRASDSVMVQT